MILSTSRSVNNGKNIMWEHNSQQNNRAHGQRANRQHNWCSTLMCSRTEKQKKQKPMLTWGKQKQTEIQTIKFIHYCVYNIQNIQWIRQWPTSSDTHTAQVTDSSACWPGLAIALAVQPREAWSSRICIVITMVERSQS